MLRSLTALEKPRRMIIHIRWLIFTRFWRMNISKSAIVSLKAHLDRTYPRGIHIGDHTYVAFGAVVLTHDRTRGLYLDTVIGKNCFIGARSIILPGVRVGDSSVIGAGSVVTKDVPPRSLVAGNPGRILREGIAVGHYGRYLEADQTTHDLKAAGLIRY